MNHQGLFNSCNTTAPLSLPVPLLVSARRKGGKGTCTVVRLQCLLLLLLLSRPLLLFPSFLLFPSRVTDFKQLQQNIVADSRQKRFGFNDRHPEQWESWFSSVPLKKADIKPEQMPLLKFPEGRDISPYIEVTR